MTFDRILGVKTYLGGEKERIGEGLASLETRVVSGNGNLGSLDTSTSESTVGVCGLKVQMSSAEQASRNEKTTNRSWRKKWLRRSDR